jgi:hypothetical protein
MEMDTNTDTIFFFVRTEINRDSICFGSVSVFFAKLFYVMNMGVYMDMAIFLLFRFVSHDLWMFRLYRNTEISCFDIKRNNRNKRLVSDSAEKVSVPVSDILKRN